MQARVRAITEIVAELQRGVKEGRDVNLNAIKRDVGFSRNNKLDLCMAYSSLSLRKDVKCHLLLLFAHVHYCCAGVQQVLPGQGTQAGGDHERRPRRVQEHPDPTVGSALTLKPLIHVVWHEVTILRHVLKVSHPHSIAAALLRSLRGHLLIPPVSRISALSFSM
jgi:hypothetical protein